MNKLDIMDPTGHTSCEWDPGNPESVAVARKAFDAATGDGYRAFRMINGSEGDQLNVFDPTAGAILMLPPLQGG